MPPLLLEHSWQQKLVCSAQNSGYSALLPFPFPPLRKANGHERVKPLHRTRGASGRVVTLAVHAHV
eukprot:6190307-Pleurochrysis_carterae.AAC.3